MPKLPIVFGAFLSYFCLMTLIQLYPPIAAATVLMIIWVVVAWRFHKTSTPGRESLGYCLWMLIVPAVLLTDFYFGDQSQPVAKGWQVMLATFAGEGFAILITFGVLQAFSPKQKLGMRIYLGGIAAAFSGFFLFSTFHL